MPYWLLSYLVYITELKLIKGNDVKIIALHWTFSYFEYLTKYRHIYFEYIYTVTV